MIQIKFPNDVPIALQQWKDEARRITDLIIHEDDLAKKHELIDKYQKHWRKECLIEWLSDFSYEKCWYTETKFGGDYQELEHFRPKKKTKNADGGDHPTHPGYYWLAFDLDNYRLCKRRPNAKKSTFFPILDERYRASCCDDDWRDELPLFLDPMDREDCLLLSFNDNGTPIPEQGIEEQDVHRVNFTIDKYYLDERVLNKRREQTWIAARQLFYKYLNDMKEAKSKPRDKVALRAEAKSTLENIKDMLKPECEFSSVAKASLIKTGEPLAINIVAQ